MYVVVQPLTVEHICFVQTETGMLSSENHLTRSVEVSEADRLYFSLLEDGWIP